MTALTWIHIAGGSAALLGGTTALMLRKGGDPHRTVGTWFFGAMLVMAGTGAIMAALKPERGTAVIGILTCYLVATSWVAARRRDGSTGRFELAGLAVAIACALAMLGFGVQGLASETGRVDSLPYVVHFPFAVLATLAAALDINVLVQREISRRQRIARHLWRMCAAFLIAAFSFFLGQQKVMPEFIQGSSLLFVPPLAVLAAMIFWIIRVRFSRTWQRRQPGPRIGPSAETARRIAPEHA